MVVNSNATTTKEAIIITAQQLFHEKGYDHVSLRDIASACGISPGNLSYHFKKKENLVVAVMENVYEGAYHDIAVGTDSTVSALLAHLTAQDERCQRYPFYFRDLLLLGESFPQIKDRQVRLREQNYFFYIRTFHALRINGYFREDIPEKQVESLAAEMTMVQVSWYLRGSMSEDRAFEDFSYVSVLAGCLYPYLTPKGVAEWNGFFQADAR